MSGGPRIGSSAAASSASRRPPRSPAGAPRSCWSRDGPLASGASGRSLSWLNSAGERSAAYHRLRLAGIDRYRTLFARHPDADWLRFDGGLTWNAPGQGAALRATAAHERAIGYDSVLLTPAEVRERFPAVDADVIPADGAIWNPGEGWVDLPALVEVLADELRALGGQVVTEAGLARLEVGDDGVEAVRTADARWSVDAAVLATGAAVPRAAAELGVPIPDATPLALLVRTEPVRTGLRAVLNTPRAALRTAPGGTLSWTRTGSPRASRATPPRAGAPRTRWSPSCWRRAPGCWPGTHRCAPPPSASAASRSRPTASRWWVRCRAYRARTPRSPTAGPPSASSSVSCWPTRC